MMNEFKTPMMATATRTFLLRALSAWVLVAAYAASGVQPAQAAVEPEKRGSQLAGQLDLSLKSVSGKNVLARVEAARDKPQVVRLEKELNELNLQISQMQAAVRVLQVNLKQSVAGISLANQAPVSELSEADRDSMVGTPVMTGVAATGAAGGMALLRQNFQKAAVLLLGLLLAGGVVSWCRKYGAVLKSGLFAKWAARRAEPVTEPPSASEIGERSLKIPAYAENQRERILQIASRKPSSKVSVRSISAAAGPRSSIRHTRYVAEASELDAMIEEAELYALHGRWDNAIEILNNIILGFPEKIEAWLLLLSIFRNTASSQQFELIARTFLRTMGSNDTWKEIQEAGRSIDPDNKLYFDPDHAQAAKSRKRTMANKRRLLGTILIDMKAISLNDLRVALAHFDHLRDGRLGQYLVTCGLIKQIQLKLALRQQEKESASLQINRAVSLNNPEKPVSISDALIKIGAVTEPELDHVLADFDPGRHGYCGNYLVTCGLITQKQLHTALLQQLSGVMAAQHVEPEDEPCVASRFATGRPVLRILK